MSEHEPDLMNRPSAATYLGVKEGQVRRYEKRGDLPVADTVMLGGQRRPMYKREDVERIKQQREQTAINRSSSVED